ncbi:MAG TPA: TetR/AcrR family transcriptional regulator [Noviherbaspirillum sp.]
MNEDKAGLQQEDPAPSPAGVRPARGAGTSEAILRTALRLMAENGYNGVSLRRICTEAKVNLALMNYHFGTKEQLLLAIFQRSGSVINDERMRLLDELDERYPDRAPPLEDLLDSFIAPTFRASRAAREDDLHFLRLSGRLATDPTPEVRKVVNEVYDSAAVRFAQRLRAACPHLSTEEFFQRLVFLYGSMVYARADTGRVDSIARKMDVELQETPMEETCRYMIPFLAAGFRAASSDPRPD